MSSLLLHLFCTLTSSNSAKELPGVAYSTNAIEMEHGQPSDTTTVIHLFHQEEEDSKKNRDDNNATVVVVFEDLEFDPSPFNSTVDKFSGVINAWRRNYGTFVFKSALPVVAFLLYNVYFIYAIIYHISFEEVDKNLDWCQGLGFLILTTAMVYVYNLYSRVFKPRFWKSQNVRMDSLNQGWNKFLALKNVNVLLHVLPVLVMAAFIITDASAAGGGNPRRLQSALGTLLH